jgi:hypothetical protein
MSDATTSIRTARTIDVRTIDVDIAAPLTFEDSILSILDVDRDDDCRRD